MKGKYAARAESRRESATLAELADARAELARERAQHARQVQEIKTELVSLRGEIMREARRLADSEIARHAAEVAKERDMVRTSRDVFEGIEYRQDKFIMNACRYLSMTEGVHPYDALNRVWTWYTEEDCYGTFADPQLLTVLGLPADGWVAWMVSKMTLPRTATRQRKQRVRVGDAVAITLDHAEEREHSDIHPEYKQWKKYYDIDHRFKLALTGEDGQPERFVK